MWEYWEYWDKKMAPLYKGANTKTYAGFYFLFKARTAETDETDFK